MAILNFTVDSALHLLAHTLRLIAFLLDPDGQPPTFQPKPTAPPDPE